MKKEVEDHLGRTVTIDFPPKRIISLAPAITETLFSLRLNKEIVGRTRFCVYPKDQVKNVRAVGGTKEINLTAIHEVKPDLIIVEKEENTKQIVEVLEEYYPVFVAEVQSIEDAYRMINDLGQLTNRQIEAAQLLVKIQSQFKSLPQFTGKRVAYVIWQKPYMVVGKDTYIQSLLEEMGFLNPFAAFEGRYPAVSVEDLQNAKLDYVLLASEPYPHKEKHKAEFLNMIPGTKPLIIDGEMFWYGAKMMEAVAYFNEHLLD